MPYLTTSQEWLTQSALLLQARPTSARITTKYTLSRPSTSLKSQKRREAAATKTADSAAAPVTSAAPKAMLTLKTYDPVSGTTLKYQTDKAQEVGRLVLSLSRLGREMAGLPELQEAVGEAMDGVEGRDAQAPAAVSGMATPVVAPQPPAAKKGKKKGKK